MYSMLCYSNNNNNNSNNNNNNTNNHIFLTDATQRLNLCIASAVYHASMSLDRDRFNYQKQLAKQRLIDTYCNNNNNYNNNRYVCINVRLGV